MVKPSKVNSLQEVAMSEPYYYAWVRRVAVSVRSTIEIFFMEIKDGWLVLVKWGL